MGAQIPGFRSGTRWKQVVAVLGYITLVSTVLAGSVGAKLWAILVLLALFLATNAWGLRGRVPGFRSTNRFQAGGAWAALIIVMLAAGLFGVPPSDPNRRTSTADAAPVAAVAETTVPQARPANTPRPSSTPRPDPTSRPSATPRPTVEPSPTLIPIPAETSAYMDYMGPKLQSVSRAMSLLSTQSSAASQNIALIRDSDWQLTTLAALAVLKSEGQNIQTYDPVPSDAKDLDVFIVAMGKDLIYIAEQYATGIDRINATNIGNAVDRMGIANAKAVQATGLIRDISAQYGR